MAISSIFISLVECPFVHEAINLWYHCSKYQLLIRVMGKGILFQNAIDYASQLPHFSSLINTVSCIQIFFLEALAINDTSKKDAGKLKIKKVGPDFI